MEIRVIQWLWAGGFISLLAIQGILKLLFFFMATILPFTKIA